MDLILEILLEQLVKLSKEEVAGKLLILINIASTNEDYLQKVYFILVRCSTSKIIVATTSGFGHYKRTTIWKMINDYWKGGFRSCRLLNFSKKEVKYFIRDTNITN